MLVARPRSSQGSEGALPTSRTRRDDVPGVTTVQYVGGPRKAWSMYILVFCHCCPRIIIERIHIRYYTAKKKCLVTYLLDVRSLDFLRSFHFCKEPLLLKPFFLKKLLKPYVSSPTPPHEKNYQGVSFSLIVTRPSKGTKTNQFAAVVDALDFTIDCKKQGCS